MPLKTPLAWIGALASLPWAGGGLVAWALAQQSVSPEDAAASCVETSAGWLRITGDEGAVVLRRREP